MKWKPVRKAVFPVAGLGTRLLPATKWIPKEMLTIVDKPLIQYAVDEAREAGIEQLVFVTGRGKAPLRGEFGEMVSVEQQEPLGLGHAIWCAKEIVGDEPFAVLLPDDLMVPGALKQMVAAYADLGGNLLLTEEVPRERTGSYGVITPGETKGGAIEVKGLVEKPKPEAAPSTMAVIGRYILQPEVMTILDAQEPGAGGEIQLTDAMAKLIGNQPFHAVKTRSVRYDCGDKAGFVRANVAIAISRSDVGFSLQDLQGLGKKLPLDFEG